MVLVGVAVVALAWWGCERRAASRRRVGKTRVFVVMTIFWWVYLDFIIIFFVKIILGNWDLKLFRH